MSDRLKQIWSGFENQTQRHLTGSGIDNIHVPHRREWRAEDSRFLPEGFDAPADRAFAALEYKLAASARKHGHRKSNYKSKSKSGFASSRAAGASFEAEHSAYGPSVESQSPAMNAGDPRQALLASLRETDFRVLRREINYMNSGTAVSAKKKSGRKKFLGLF